MSTAGDASKPPKVVIVDDESTMRLRPGLPGQIEQVIMNLVINARDAMPQGAETAHRPARIPFRRRYCGSHLGVSPGPFVLLAISDTGMGMDLDTQARIFEPFFSTKELDRGTGLALATVHGIIDQSGGVIWVYSDLGQGSIFKIYLPEAEPWRWRADGEASTGQPQGP